MYAVITDDLINTNAVDANSFYPHNTKELIDSKVELLKDKTVVSEVEQLMDDIWFVTPDPNIPNMLHIFYRKPIDSARIIDIVDRFKEVLLCYGLSHSICVKVGKPDREINQWLPAYLSRVHGVKIVAAQVLQDNKISLLGL